MSFTDESICALRERIRQRLSGKRYEHTLGVESTVSVIADYIMPQRKGELRAAALLHDVAKELRREELVSLITPDMGVCEDELESEAVLHAFAASTVVKSDFPELASEDVLSAVFNHTTGDENMSLFDEIIFVADYIEPARTFPLCIETRQVLFDGLCAAHDREECVLRLHEAAYAELTNTVKHLSERGVKLNERTLRALHSIEKKLGLPDNR